MKVVLTPAPIKEVIDHTISIGDQRIGTVKTLENSSFKYHVILTSKRELSIYQGLGLTIDEALRDAITRSREQRQFELVELDELENVIWGDHELNK